jgi:hypothetical protein
MQVLMPILHIDKWEYSQKRISVNEQNQPIVSTNSNAFFSHH